MTDSPHLERDDTFTAADVFGTVTAGRNSVTSPQDRHLWETLPHEIASRWDDRQGMTVSSLGMYLKNRNGRYFGDYAVRLIPDGSKGNAYQIVRYEPSK